MSARAAQAARHKNAEAADGSLTTGNRRTRGRGALTRDAGGRLRRTTPDVDGGSEGAAEILTPAPAPAADVGDVLD